MADAYSVEFTLSNPQTAGSAPIPGLAVSCLILKELHTGASDQWQAETTAQNGSTMTRITITIISTVGISFIRLNCFPVVRQVPANNSLRFLANHM